MKANATQGIPEMIEIACKYYRENKERASIGEMRGMVGIAIIRGLKFPVYKDDEIERYNIFHASLIVRYSEDNEYHDIIDIKKKRATRLSRKAVHDINPFYIDDKRWERKCQSEYSKN